MAEVSAAARPQVWREFRIGRILARTAVAYRRNFLPFSVIAFAASLPSVLIFGASDSGVDALSMNMVLLSMLLSIVLFFLSQAMLVFGAFQDLRGRPVNLIECLRVGLSRLFPVLAIALLAGLTITLVFAAMLLIDAAMGATFALAPSVVAPVLVIIIATVGGLVAMGIILAMWFVAVPACTVEHRGPIGSLRRSAQLTKGHRWRLFGVVLVLLLGGQVAGEILVTLLGEAAGAIVKQAGSLAWNTVWGAFFAVFVVVTYYELRAGKEGVNIEQIASVFD